MKNTITVNTATHNISFVVADAERPFSNNFVQNSAEIVQYDGQDEVFAYVTCTADSNEPGRIYACSYSLTEKLEGCNTVN